MKKRFILFALVATTVSTLTAQLNVELQSNLPYQYTLNDIWGYETPDGIEYALVGTTAGLSIVSLEDPTQPKELQFVPGENTVWRDIKSWGEFAYVVSDNTSEGMLIVDMSSLPDSAATFTYWKGPVGELGELRKSHNIYIDEFGLAYLAGSNLGSIIVLDLKENPWEPKFILKTDSPYSHDVYARDSVIYTSEIYGGVFGAYDFKDVNDVKFLGGAPTPSHFTHNTWLSDDTNTIYTTDERANGYIASFDISDYSDVKELDRFRPAATEFEDVIPHNVHVYDDYLVISYYTDGVIIVDAARPDNLIEVGNYDTYPGESGGYNGAWGAYPFLPSGSTLVADRQSGLYVVKPDYVRGCYLEGKVLDAVTKEPILNAELSISGDEVISAKYSDIAGEFKMGKAVPGGFTVSAEHKEYEVGSVEAVFENGVQTDVVIYLEPKPRVTISGIVLSATQVGPAPNANVILVNGDFTYEATTNSNGVYVLSDIIGGTYKMYAGNWGEYAIREVDITATDSEDILILPGYYDDFHFEYNWSVSGTSTGAHWERGLPNLETLGGNPCNPGSDVEEDVAFSAYMTGNAGGDARDDSVEEGFTMVSSPSMDLASMIEPKLQFRPWLCARFTDFEAYSVLLSSGTDTVVIDTVFIQGSPGFWRDTYEYSLEGMMPLTDDMQIHFKAESTVVGNVIKAALDEFLVSGSLPSATEDVESSIDFAIYPNPSSGQFTIDLGDDNVRMAPEQVVIFNNLGQAVESVKWAAGQTIMTIDRGLSPGIYFVQLNQDGKASTTQKLVVQ